MSEQVVPSAVAQRIVIKFLANEKVKPIEILIRLRKQFGNETLSRTQVFAWHKSFAGGRSEVQNLPHPRRPKTSIISNNIQAVRGLIEGNRRLTVDEICKSIGISHGSVQSIIHNDLKFRKISARWVPRLLNADQKAARTEISQRLLNRYEAEGDAFLNRILTCDETWVHHYTPESKRSSMEWRRKNEAGPVKAKTKLSAGKILATVFWDYRGVVFVDFLEERRTINATYYCELLDKVKTSYRSKRRGVPIRSVLLLHDNARPHTAALTKDKLTKMHWTTIEHAPYSPDLSPCDYHLFGPLKEALGGQQFQNNEEVKQFVCNWLRTRPTSFYNKGIQKLPIRWQKCVNVNGNYVEK